MGDRKLPPEVLRVIEAGEGEWTLHAAEDALRLALYWDDVIAVARTGSRWKRTRDEMEEAVDGFKHSFESRDRRGRLLYVAGKQVYSEGEIRWHVITFHESKRS